MNGFARIKCAGCGVDRLLHFSCKTRGFCPSCHARRSEEWSRWFAETLSAPVPPYHQIVFTMPKMLRAYFRHDRTLMSDLSRAAYRAVARFVAASTGPGTAWNIAMRCGRSICRQAWGRRRENRRFPPSASTPAGFTKKSKFLLNEDSAAGIVIAELKFVAAGISYNPGGSSFVEYSPHPEDGIGEVIHLVPVEVPRRKSQVNAGGPNGAGYVRDDVCMDGRPDRDRCIVENGFFVPGPHAE